MAITDELREWIENSSLSTWSCDKLLAIADRIDAEHQRKVEETASGWDYWESTHIKLPVDADGVPIHVGDVMEDTNPQFEGTQHETFMVYGIQYRAYDQEVALTRDGYPTILHRAGECRHYHAPTVEDVVSDLVDHATSIGTAYANNDMDGESMLEGLKALVAEYAAKLRLAEEVDA